MAVLNKGHDFSDGDQVTADKLDNAVDAATFAAGAVDNASTQLSGGAIIVKDAGVTAAKLATDSVTTTKILDANVTTTKILDANVTTAKIADANVTTTKIADANVTTAKMAANAVTTDKILDANVTTAKIAANSVTTAKILNANVTTAKIADANVTTAKIADANVLGKGHGQSTGSPQEIFIDNDLSNVNAYHNTVVSAKAVKNYVDNVTTAALELSYPIGSIYINATNATNPNTLLGFGTWTAFGAGRVPVGIDAGQTEFNTAEETGGAKTHTLTTSEMPSHSHSYTRKGTVTGGSTQGGDPNSVGQFTDNTGLTGGGQAHNNLQPYIVVYMWKRTA
jgi:hypothetical protein